MWITNLIFCTYGQMVFAIWSMILDSCQNMIFIWRWRRRVWCLRGKCNWIGRRFWDHFIYSMYLRRRIYHRLCSICFRLGGWFFLFVCLLGSLPNFLLQNDFKNVQWKLQFILWKRNIIFQRRVLILSTTIITYPKNSGVKKYHEYTWNKKWTQRGVDDVFRVVKLTNEFIFWCWYAGARLKEWIVCNGRVYVTQKWWCGWRKYAFWWCKFHKICFRCFTKIAMISIWCTYHFWTHCCIGAIWII